MKAKKTADLGPKVRAYFRAKKLAKLHYGRADRILDELARTLKPGEEIPLSEKSKAVLKDNFASTNLVFGHGGVRRYELEIIEA